MADFKTRQRVASPLPTASSVTAPVGQPDLGSMEEARARMAADRALVESMDGVCYLTEAAVQERLATIPSVSPGQGLSHPLEGNPVYEWSREGGGYDDATMFWRLFNDLFGPEMPGGIIPPPVRLPPVTG